MKIVVPIISCYKCETDLVTKYYICDSCFHVYCPSCISGDTKEGLDVCCECEDFERTRDDDY